MNAGLELIAIHIIQRATGIQFNLVEKVQVTVAIDEGRHSFEILMSKKGMTTGFLKLDKFWRSFSGFNTAGLLAQGGTL
jgi:hypothetical protein